VNDLGSDIMNLNYTLALSLSAIVSIAILVVALNRISAPGAVGLVLSMASMTIWAITYAIRWSVTDINAQYFWLDATYLGVVTIPTFILILSLEFSHRSHLLTTRNLVLLGIEPILTLLFLWTDKYHGLFFAGQRSTGTILNGGPWFWINLIYSYSVLIIAVGLLVQIYFHGPRLYRRQVGTMLLGMMLLLIPNIITTANLSPFPDLDITPFLFTVCGLVFALALFQFHFLDIVPIARDKLIENMNDGLIVLDFQGRIVDINPTAQVILKLTPSCIGCLADLVFAEWPEIRAMHRKTIETRSEVRIQDSSPLDFDVRTIPIFDKKVHLNGWMILLHDVTDLKRAEEQLQELTLVDELTGLYNRRGFMLLASQLIKTTDRMGKHALLVYIDVDDLKYINDNLGHNQGDRALISTANILRNTFRGSDIIARLSGDEFVGLAIDSQDDLNEILIGRLQETLSDHLLHENSPYQLSFSYGISQYDSVHPCSLEELLEKADKAMYKQKRAKKHISRKTKVPA
jgi:diguanylate cyclase (GGDEF)-like protein